MGMWRWADGGLDQLGTIGGVEPLQRQSALGLGLEVVLGLLFPMDGAEPAAGFAADAAAISVSLSTGVASLATQGEEGVLVVYGSGHGGEE